MKIGFLSFTFISLITLFSFSLRANETDQFTASEAVIEDSSEAMNGFFQDRIHLGLHKANKKSIEKCQDVASIILTQVVGAFSPLDYLKDKTFSKVSLFTKHSPLVEHYPSDLTKERQFRKSSIYRKRPFPINVAGVSRTININGIYIGTDKLGHFSIVGKTYYKHYLKGLENGFSVDEAEDFAITKGLMQERAILGYLIGGTFSFGDLEANYQGLQFARNMCRGENPHLVLKQGVWSENSENPFNITHYINPKMDEAYNVSFWSPRLWKKMRKDIVKAYCKNKKSPSYIKREAYYNSIVKETHNDSMIQDFVMRRSSFDRQTQLLSSDISCENF